jgi:hypothetical protein
MMNGVDFIVMCCRIASVAWVVSLLIFDVHSVHSVVNFAGWAFRFG